MRIVKNYDREHYKIARDLDQLKVGIKDIVTKNFNSVFTEIFADIKRVMLEGACVTKKEAKYRWRYYHRLENKIRLFEKEKLPLWIDKLIEGFPAYDCSKGGILVNDYLFEYYLLNMFEKFIEEEVNLEFHFSFIKFYHIGHRWIYDTLMHLERSKLDACGAQCIFDITLLARDLVLSFREEAVMVPARKEL